LFRKHFFLKISLLIDFNIISLAVMKNDSLKFFRIFHGDKITRKKFSNKLVHKESSGAGKGGLKWD